MISKSKLNPVCTDRLEVEESLEGFLQEGVFRTSPERGIVYANAAIVGMFGYSSLEDIMSVPGHELYADEEARAYLMDKIRAEGIIVDHRVLYKKKNGRNFWGLLTCRQIKRHGETLLEGRIHDISSLVKTEDQLKDSEIKIEKLNMELDRFVYSASHDIRSPVSTILGIINLMKIDLKDDLTQKYTAMIETSVARLDHFVRGLTSFSQNSKKTIDDAGISFEPLLKDILDGFGRDHPFFDLITWSIEVNAPYVFFSDKDRLNMVLYNTIKNSLDFCDQMKSNRVISIQVQTDHDKALIEIFDNGIGISAMHIGRVFDMFYRGTDLSKGSGIGLYTVREAVTLLGGIITIDSEYGVGTSVKIELPNSKKGKLINKKNQLRLVK